MKFIRISAITVALGLLGLGPMPQRPALGQEVASGQLAPADPATEAQKESLRKFNEECSLNLINTLKKKHLDGHVPDALEQLDEMDDAAKNLGTGTCTVPVPKPEDGPIANAASALEKTGVKAPDRYVAEERLHHALYLENMRHAAKAIAKLRYVFPEGASTPDALVDSICPPPCADKADLVTTVEKTFAEMKAKGLAQTTYADLGNKAGAVIDSVNISRSLGPNTKRVSSSFQQNEMQTRFYNESEDRFFASQDSQEFKALQELSLLKGGETVTHTYNKATRKVDGHTPFPNGRTFYVIPGKPDTLYGVENEPNGKPRALRPAEIQFLTQAAPGEVVVKPNSVRSLTPEELARSGGQLSEPVKALDGGYGGAAQGPKGSDVGAYEMRPYQPISPESLKKSVDERISDIHQLVDFVQKFQKAAEQAGSGEKLASPADQKKHHQEIQKNIRAMLEASPVAATEALAKNKTLQKSACRQLTQIKLDEGRAERFDSAKKSVYLGISALSLGQSYVAVVKDVGALGPAATVLTTGVGAAEFYDATQDRRRLEAKIPVTKGAIASGTRSEAAGGAALARQQGQLADAKRRQGESIALMTIGAGNLSVVALKQNNATLQSLHRIYDSNDKRIQKGVFTVSAAKFLEDVRHDRQLKQDKPIPTQLSTLQAVVSQDQAVRAGVSDAAQNSPDPNVILRVKGTDEKSGTVQIGITYGRRDGKGTQQQDMTLSAAQFDDLLRRISKER